MADIIIVGAGLSGLIAAWRACQQGHTVKLLEQSDRPGGLMGTQYIAQSTDTGYWVENGPHTFPASASHVLQLCDALALSPQVLDAKNRYLAHTSTNLVKAPQGPLSALTTSLLSPAGKCRLLAEPFMPADPQEQTVAQFVSQRLGPEVVDNLVAPLLTGIYAGDVNQLSATAVMPTLVDWAQQHGSLLKGAMQRNKQATSINKSAYPKRAILGFAGGMQTLVDALVAQLPSDTLQLNTPVKAIDPLPGNRWQLHTESTVIVGDTLSLAIPAHQASPLVQPWQPEMAQALGGIPYSPITVLHLGLPIDKVQHPLDGFGFLVPPRLNLPILGCIFASTLFPQRAPAGHVLLTVMVGGSLRPDLTTLPDDALLAQVWQALTPLLGLNNLSDVTMMHRIDWPQAIPQLTMGHGQRWQTIQQAQTTHFKILGNFGKGIALQPLVSLAWS